MVPSLSNLSRVISALLRRLSAGCSDNNDVYYWWRKCKRGGVGTLYDIRSPLGISPAALRANKAAPQVGAGLRPAKEQGYSAYQSYRKTRADLLKTQSKKRLKAVAVDFRRIWWDKGRRGGSREGAGIWRPVPPPGYVSLGEHV